METEDNDFQLLLKRIAGTTLLFALVYGVYYLYPDLTKNLFKTPEKEETITVGDTITVHSKDALEFQIITSMQVKIDPKKMGKQEHFAYNNSKKTFLDRYLRLPIRDRVRSLVQQNVKFEKADSLDTNLHDLRNVIDDAIGHQAYAQNNLNDPNGIAVVSYWFDIKLDPVIGVIIANRKAITARMRLQRMQDVMNSKVKKHH